MIRFIRPRNRIELTHFVIIGYRFKNCVMMNLLKTVAPNSIIFLSDTDGMNTERLKGKLPEIIEDNIKEIKEMFNIL